MAGNASTRASSVVLPLAVLLLVAGGALQAFVPAPGAASSLHGAEPAAAAVAYGALAAAMPAPAQAFSETELNQFGLAFSIFFLGFWIAGFFRLLTVGKL
ncbi:unnamed protein product [Polarella glacialis]|uniref:Uncharacterized protein n=1 Tax=Polarella glacialis TaxID=89957 RepID=A0A813KRQ2_POLGL|nr:unnamed protein product [Polarella glacialis]